MAFISMMFASFALAIVVIGLILLLIAMILDVIWFVNAKREKKSHIVMKVFAVLTSLGGIVLFVLPVGGLTVLGMLGKVSKNHKLDSYANKVYLSEDYSWTKDGFEYKGKQLVRIDFVNYSIKSDMDIEPDGAIILNENKYYEIYEIANDNNYHIYCVDKLVEDMYCYEEEYDEIYEYYYHKAPLNAEIHCYDDSSQYHNYDCEFDSERLFEIRSLYKEKSDDIVVDVKDIDLDYSVNVKSADGLFYERIDLIETGDTIALSDSISGGKHSAISLSVEDAEYVRKVVREYTDLYN